MTQGKTCPHCGQVMPESKLDRIIKENAEKANLVAYILKIAKETGYDDEEQNDKS